MPSCIFKCCKSCSQTQKKEDGISFHRLPIDHALRNEWVSIIRQSRRDNDWLPSQFCVVCSLHFKEDDVYFSENGRRLIKKTSKPTQNLSALPPSTQISNDAESLMCPIALEDQAGPSNLLIVNQLPVKTEVRTPEPEIRDSDLDSVYDSPSTSKLKKDLRKHKLLRSATSRKIKTLRQKIRRLKKRNASLKNILKFYKLPYT
ncbi:THAP domain-containing protein 2-like [Hyposmocoma kahamanoa]|uniref:THAP domain-containing protein 2-like n=1 Tax=Hyposmocoma kahamanoa TaxID=1477025 RepID=UPI000E6DA214|nr:THAP domain-containing protein 2-like [Hyposmocoma kahamanoa]